MYHPDDDNELDRLSRDAAEHAASPGNASWSRMAQELDKVMPQEKKKRRLVLLWWLLPCLLATGLSFYFWNQYHERPQAKLKSPVALPVHQDSEPPVTSLPENTILKTHPPAPVTEEASPLLAQLNHTSIDSKNTLRSNNSPASSLSQQLGASVLPPPAYDEIRSQQPATKEVAGNNTPMHNGLDHPLAAGVGNDTHHKDTTILQQQNHHPVDTSLIAHQEPNTSSLYSKFSMGVIAGADLSNVKFRYTETPGYNIGLMAGYHLNKHWSLHTGAIYTKKNYKMDGADFTAPKGSPASYWNLTNVEGDCSMWDIPLLVRFHPGKKSTSRFSFSTGLSSYFMKDENYDYYYPSPTTGAIVKKSGYYNTGSSYWFSVVHLSAGFEKPISKKVSMQLEPYIKLPLAGLGVGSMRLNSLGLNVTVQYRSSKEARISTSSSAMLVSH